MRHHLQRGVPQPTTSGRRDRSRECHTQDSRTALYTHLLESPARFFCQTCCSVDEIFPRAALHEKSDLLYTGRDIRLFKLRGRLQGGATMQTGAEWQQAQDRTQRPTGTKCIPMEPPVIVPDSVCVATAAAPPLQLTERQLKTGVLDGSIPSAAYDTT